MNNLVKLDTYNNSSNAVTVYYAKNGHGDIVNLTNSNGDNIKNYQYDAFGIEVDKDENDFNPFRYCGEYFDNETDNYYLRARYYNPSLGRFITEDPARDGINWYSYCSNNPVGFIDPSGESMKDVFKGMLDTADESICFGLGSYISDRLVK